MLQTLRKYSGRLNTQLGLRLLLLTGVRTGELRYATPDQFDLERGLWIIPVVRLKQRKQLTKKKRQRFADIPPYIVPLSLQAQEVVRHLLGNLKPAQVYLIPGDWCLKNLSARTRSMARSSVWDMKTSSLGTAFAPPSRPRSMNWAIRPSG